MSPEPRKPSHQPLPILPEVAGGRVPERPTGSGRSTHKLGDTGTPGRSPPPRRPAGSHVQRGARLPVLVVGGEAGEARHAARVVVLQALEQLAEFLLVPTRAATPCPSCRPFLGHTQGHNSPHTPRLLTWGALPAPGAVGTALETSQRAFQILLLVQGGHRGSCHPALAPKAAQGWMRYQEIAGPPTHTSSSGACVLALPCPCTEPALPIGSA